MADQTRTIELLLKMKLSGEEAVKQLKTNLQDLGKSGWLLPAGFVEAAKAGEAVRKSVKGIGDEAKVALGGLEGLAAAMRKAALERRQSGKAALQRAMMNPMGMTGAAADLLGVGMPVMAAEMVGRQLENFGEKLVSIRDRLREGKTEAAELMREFAKSLPVIGSWVSFGLSIRELITEERLQIEEVQKATARSVAISDAAAAFARAWKAAMEDVRAEGRKLSRDIAMIGATPEAKAALAAEQTLDDARRAMTARFDAMLADARTKAKTEKDALQTDLEAANAAFQHKYNDAWSNPFEDNPGPLEALKRMAGMDWQKIHDELPEMQRDFVDEMQADAFHIQALITQKQGVTTTLEKKITELQKEQGEDRAKLEKKFSADSVERVKEHGEAVKSALLQQARDIQDTQERAAAERLKAQSDELAAELQQIQDAASKQIQAIMTASADKMKALGILQDTTPMSPEAAALLAGRDAAVQAVYDEAGAKSAVAQKKHSDELVKAAQQHEGELTKALQAAVAERREIEDKAAEEALRAQDRKLDAEILALRNATARENDARMNAAQQKIVEIGGLFDPGSITGVNADALRLLQQAAQTNLAATAAAEAKILDIRIKAERQFLQDKLAAQLQIAMAVGTAQQRQLAEAKASYESELAAWNDMLKRKLISKEEYDTAVQRSTEKKTREDAKAGNDPWAGAAAGAAEVSQSLKSLGQFADEVIWKIHDDLVEGLSSAFVDVLSRAKSVADALRGLASSLLGDLAKMLARQAFSTILTPLFGSLSMALGGKSMGAIGFAEGGMVPGAWGGRDDRVIAVGGGEYVVPNHVMKQQPGMLPFLEYFRRHGGFMGGDLMRDIRAGLGSLRSGAIPGFAAGGPVLAGMGVPQIPLGGGTGFGGGGVLGAYVVPSEAHLGRMLAGGGSALHAWLAANASAVKQGLGLS